MSRREPSYDLPKQLERWLAALTKIYVTKGFRQQAEILVNAQMRVHEGWTFDNWNGGTYGHALYLVLREDLYLAAVEQKDSLAEQIRSDLNRLHHVQSEFVAEVFFEMEATDEHDWRAESGLLVSSHPALPAPVLERIWGDGYRVFLSHKAEAKQRAGELKQQLSIFGASCFVAHEDIRPTCEWQNEIERALASMDALVALMTEAFHESFWTDQEVGYAFGRGVPIVCVKLGRDPYGFIGKFQALSCEWEKVPTEVAKLLIKQPRMVDAFVAAVGKCESFDQGNMLAAVLPVIERITSEQAQALVSAYNENGQVSGSYGFNGSNPRFYGDGLPKHLSRLTGRRYEVVSGELRQVLV